MDLAIFEARELRPVLGALREVALANHEFVPAEAELIEGIARLHGETLHASELPSAGFESVAQVLIDPHRRKRAVQLAIVTSLVEGQPTPDSVAAVRRFAHALDVSEAGLRVLSEVAHGHALFARFDIARRMQRFLSHSGGPGLLKLALPLLLGLGEDDRVAAPYLALGELPPASLGRTLFEHYREHGFAFPGEKGGVPSGMVFHDIGHIVSGYGVDPQGEIQQAAFQAGFARNDGFLFLLFGILQFHVGLRLTPVAKAERGYFDVPRVLKALERGAACKVDFSDRFDLFEHAAVPLSTLRARWNVQAA
jgi:hypothetical protein